ncbi:uncharacterized protein BCR38DRAFT_419500 [Pseudomassariella vexata]|uniref:HMG box domain-containing protein n=1 Tax=Pseudomassariella vexata TaxID=1141098 RepID=A0A1Y2EDD6_9PEZI|nr:uncharacterized protein BCR38DRAFT_419500 [Pseudomassariella vexata]ORY69589.1 hypothetical protein BCR38DRAFT_419500 [Pseudomassariella vexata]
MAPQSSTPPSLPPTVEDAYRRKCIELKARYKEIEDENDAYRLRLTRLKRQIQKCRLERAILLEQISKRTSTNVADSEGSPSPPPTPKDKPLRIKRGHRKLPGGIDDGSFMSHSIRGLSPGSETYSHNAESFPSGRGGGGAAVSNGLPKPPKRPSNAFEIYCNDMRPQFQAKHKDKIEAGKFRLEEELARGWKDLPKEDKDAFQTRYEQELGRWKEEREAYRRGAKEAAARDRSRGRDSYYGGGGGGAGSGSGRGRGSAAARHRIERILQDDDGDDQDQYEDQDVEMGEAADAMDAEDRDNDPAETDPETEVEDNEAQGEE